ncbi:putative efflux pump kojT [Lasiodiplodia hormozganensis]|uniref:Efflux pump kojT n=1 Tax=Lasiodiplodia hormozganensis TaxID=869390 RepID=A0AA40C0S2_9PEZI|nr:putative efflux pump kojT [Lasiodiplodia hormozganensis]
MQSILQYRRFGLAAQAQIQRDLEKANTITLRPQPEQSRAPSVQSEKERGDLAGKEEEEKEEKEDTFTPGRSTDSVSISSSNSSTSQEIEPVAVDRVHTAATVRTQYTARAALGHSLTGIEARDRRTHEGKGEQVFVVGWEGDSDPLNPRNWSTPKRVGVTLQIAAVAFAVCAASSIDAAVLPQGAAEFGVSEVAETLATGMFLIGFGCGSLVAGPFSETFGRNIVYMGSLAVYSIWIMAAGLAPNFGAQIVFRFLAGCSASTPLTCAGGSVSDMYNGIEKTWGFPLFAIAAFGGPVLGPVIGAYIGPSPLISWRWSEWIMLITSGLVLTMLFFCMPETFAPVLLQWKAQHLRKITGDHRFQAEHEIVEATLFTRLKIAMTRPFLMVTEPIIILMTLYLSVIYIVLFTFLDGYAYIFQKTYGISQGLTDIIFVAMFIGIVMVVLLVPVVYRITVKDLKRANAKGAAMFNPETRLWYAMLGAAPAIPIALFWQGWTARASISIWSPIISTALFGYGIIGIFLSAYMYIIDSYEMYAASALTFVTLVRYFAAGGMTVVGIPFYENMGVPYTLTILACIAALMTPIPYALYKWGHLVRQHSKYAVTREV